MNSHLTKDFINHFKRLPERIRKLARKNYRIWKKNPSHPSIAFKPVIANLPVYSVRIGIGWRALGLKKENTMIWFWIGSHAEYEKQLKKFRSA